MLGDSNIYNRKQANSNCPSEEHPQQSTPSEELTAISLDRQRPMKTRMHAVWALIGSGNVPDSLLLRWLDARMRNCVAGVFVPLADRQVNPRRFLQSIQKLAATTIPCSNSSRYRDSQARSAYYRSALGSTAPQSADPILPRVVWQNLLPRLKQDQSRIHAAILADTSRRGHSYATDAACRELLAGRNAGVSGVGAADSRVGVQSLDSSRDAAAHVLNAIVNHLETRATRDTQSVDAIRRWIRFESTKQRFELAVSIAQAHAEKGPWSEAIESLKLTTGARDALQRAREAIVQGDLSNERRIALLRLASLQSTENLSEVLTQTIKKISAKKKVDDKYLLAVVEMPTNGDCCQRLANSSRLCESR